MNRDMIAVQKRKMKVRSVLNLARFSLFPFMIIRNQPTGFYYKCDAQNPMYRQRKLS